MKKIITITVEVDVEDDETLDEVVGAAIVQFEDVQTSAPIVNHYAIGETSGAWRVVGLVHYHEVVYVDADDADAAGDLVHELLDERHPNNDFVDIIEVERTEALIESGAVVECATCAKAGRSVLRYAAAGHECPGCGEVW